MLFSGVRTCSSLDLMAFKDCFTCFVVSFFFESAEISLIRWCSSLFEVGEEAHAAIAKKISGSNVLSGLQCGIQLIGQERTKNIYLIRGFSNSSCLDSSFLC